MTSVYIVRADSFFRVKLKSDSTADFARCIEALKSAITHDRRSFKTASREWEVDADADAEIKCWLKYCHTEIGADVIWMKGSEHRQRHTHPPREHRQKPIDPYVTLHLLPSAPTEVIRAAFKALAMKHHPDHGGDEEQMKRLNAAFKILAA
jgi:hypothetical protein